MWQVEQQFQNCSGSAVKQPWKLVVNLLEQGFVSLVCIAKSKLHPFLFSKSRSYFDNDSNKKGQERVVKKKLH